MLSVFADKEEVGSNGNTGMQSKVICDVIDTLANSFGVNPIEVRYNSKCISADVTAGYDPLVRIRFRKTQHHEGFRAARLFPNTPARAEKIPLTTLPRNIWDLSATF